MRIENLDTILALENTQSAVMRIWEAMFNDWSSERSMDELSDAQRKFSVVYDLESEVNNGGFHQYFNNDAGDDSDLCLSALREMGANVASDLLAQALAIFPDTLAIEDRDARQEILQELDDEASKRLNPLDARWYKEVGDLSPFVMLFVKNNRALF